MTGLKFVNNQKMCQLISLRSRAKKIQWPDAISKYIVSNLFRRVNVGGMRGRWDTVQWQAQSVGKFA